MNHLISSRWFAIFALALTSPGLIRAELSWDSKPVESKVEAGTESITHIYEIKNTGSKPVRLQRLESDCPCIFLDNKTEILAPGSVARIEARFDIGDRIGTQLKRITVFTDDPRDSVVALTWNIQIPEVMRIRPVFLHWIVGAEPLEQEAKAEVILAGGKIKSWRLEKKVFRAKIKESEPGVLDIRIQPETTASPLQDKLIIELLQSDKTTRLFSLRLLIR